MKGSNRTITTEVYETSNFVWEDVKSNFNIFTVRFLDKETKAEKVVQFFPESGVLNVNGVTFKIESIEEADPIVYSFLKSNVNLVLVEKHKPLTKLNDSTVKIVLDRNELTDDICRNHHKYCNLNDLLKAMDERKIVGAFNDEPLSIYGIQSFEKATHLVLGFYPEEGNLVVIIEWLNTPFAKSVKEAWNNSNRLQFYPCLIGGKLSTFNIMTRQSVLS